MSGIQCGTMRGEMEGNSVWRRTGYDGFQGDFRSLSGVESWS